MFSAVAPEILLASLALLIAFNYPQLGSRWLARVEKAVGALARGRKTSVLVCGLLALAARAALLPVLAIPVPVVHDEFSHLLLADTLLHGWVTNPPHPMWTYFETLHVIF